MRNVCFCASFNLWDKRTDCCLLNETCPKLTTFSGDDILPSFLFNNSVNEIG